MVTQELVLSGRNSMTRNKIGISISECNGCPWVFFRGNKCFSMPSSTLKNYNRGDIPRLKRWKTAIEKRISKGDPR